MEIIHPREYMELKGLKIEHMKICMYGSSMRNGIYYGSPDLPRSQLLSWIRSMNILFKRIADFIIPY